MMDGKRRIVLHHHNHHHDEMEEIIKKGPWKIEEDEVLINHVKKYGPRDWSSIRSKGLLHRTGKSCRLRWVNKLRPDLKNGVKFTTEEERIVIDLQAKFGNKWARIATYLKGRTDNDVKNFWSSRQKRLARILQNSAAVAPSSSKSQKYAKEALHHFSSVEAPTTEQESFTKPQCCSSSHIDDSQTIKMVPLPDLVYPSLLSYEHIPLQQNYNPQVKIELPQPHLSFPELPQLQPDFPLALDYNQDFITRLGDSNFIDVLGGSQLPIMPSFFGPGGSCEISGTGGGTPDSFIDDFPPIDMFDNIEPLPSPSEWS